MEKIKLDYPVEVSGVKVDTLTMRRPKVGDLIQSEKNGGGPLQFEAWVFAKLCDVEPDAIAALDMADYLKLQEISKGFPLPRGPS